MAEALRMPKLSDEMKEATISRWLKSVGEPVEVGEPVVEVETDKVIVEVEAQCGGVVLEILAQAQEVVQVDQPLCRIGEAGQHTASDPRRTGASEGPAEAKTPSGMGTEGAEPSGTAAGRAATGERSSNVVRMMLRGPAREPGDSRADPAPQRSLLASPLARRVADELGLDLTTVQGTGAGGKIVMADLQPFLDTPSTQPGPSVAAAAPMAEREPRSGPAPASFQGVQPGPGQAGAGEAAYADIPHTALRRTIARRMHQAKNDIPHFYMTAEIDVTEVLALRERLNARLEQGRIRVNDVMIKAAALALEQVPALNATWGEEALRRYAAVHMGFAVAIGEGLVTPVVRDCHLKSIGRIARETRDLADRAHRRALTGEDLQGATFTLSNLGMYEVVEFSAIINPPQVGILAIARPMERPVADAGRVVIRSRLNATLSADHRAVDGVTGAEFLKTFKAVLEQPERLML